MGFKNQCTKKQKKNEQKQVRIVHQFEEVDKFKYLGVTIKSNSEKYTEVQKEWIEEMEQIAAVRVRYRIRSGDRQLN